jgi:ribulose-phosphate 3-epimerase
LYISASIYSNKNTTLKDLVMELDMIDVDYFHIDSNDSMEVFKDIENIATFSKTPIDLHIISDRPADFIPHILENKINRVCFQIENLPKDFSIPNDLAPFQGIAIQSDTDYCALEPYLSQINYLLIMTTTPGQSGGVFDKKNFDYIRKVSLKYPSLKIQVDGGVTNEVSFILRMLGVSGIVSGSYLVNHQNVGTAMIQLRSKNVASTFMIEDFMIPLEELPLINKSDISLLSLLEKIEKYKMGSVFVVENDQFVGICTNADIRKGMLKNIDTLNNINVEDFININPLYVAPNHTSTEMLEIIRSVDFPVLILPVIDNNRTFKGALMFNKLIKSE